MSYVSVWRATARALTELGAGAFFAGGVAWAVLGPPAPWFVLAVVVIGMLLRAADVEARALFVPGGLYGSVRETLGPIAARTAAAALLVDRLVLGSLAAVLVGHYAIALSRSIGGSAGITVSGDTAPLVIAATVIALLWLLQRQGRALQDHTVARLIGASVGVLGLFLIGAAIAVLRSPASADLMRASWPWHLEAFERTPSVVARAVAIIGAIGFALPALGGVGALGIASLDLQPPRIRNLRRVTHLVSGYAIVIIAGLTLVGVAVIPPADLRSSAFASLTGIARHLPAPGWSRFGFLIGIAAAACVFLTATVRSTSTAAHGVLTRLIDDGTLPDRWRTLHPRFGTPFRIIDATAAIQLGIVLLAGQDVAWLARVYAMGVVVGAVFKVTALIRYRFLRPEPRAFEVPFNVNVGGNTWPLGLIALVVLLTAPAAVLLFRLDPPSLAATALVATMTAMLALSARATSATAGAAMAAADPFQLLRSDDVDLRQVQARPGNFLVPVRKPHTLTHLAAAFRAAGSRDVVAVTVRLVGVDVPDDPAVDPHITDDERHLLSAVTAAAEREGRAVRLMIVPGVNVFDSLVDTALRLRSSEIHVGESETLSADDQARLLGEAWERAARPSDVDLRLVVHHPRGGAAAYHLGAHAPALRPEDFEQIHRVWLDVVRAVGPRVHHRDVVRAALTHMEQELNGPNRDGVLQILRDTARPADEIAALIRERDYGRLRDVLRNRPPSDLAAVLTDLSTDEQVLVFRILPRKNAADAFAYLSLEQQNALLKAMASEEAAALLNAMAPDDRTTFLEELPADATRQLLALLTPEERAVAVRLLGYPDGSIGRLMTPHYVAVRERWTVAEVLDYVRRHGQDSETLNVIYVIDENGADRRHPDQQDPDGGPGRDGAQPDGSPVRRAQGHRRSGSGRARVSCRGPRRAAGHRHRGHPHRDRHRRRRARRRGAGGDRGYSAAGRIRSARPPVHGHDLRADGAEARGMVDGAVPRRNADGDRDGSLRARDRAGGRARALRAADHFERRQLRIAGLHAGDSRAGTRRGNAGRLVARHAAGDRCRPGARRHPRLDRVSPNHHVVGVLVDLRRALAARRDYRGDRARGRRAVGNAGRFALAVRAAAAWLRSRGLIGAVRRNTRRRHRADYLFLGRDGRAPRNTIVTHRRRHQRRARSHSTARLAGQKVLVDQRRPRALDAGETGRRQPVAQVCNHGNADCPSIGKRGERAAVARTSRRARPARPARDVRGMESRE